MKPFFLLLGLLLGLGIGKWGDIPFCIGLCVIAVIFGAFSYRKGLLGFYLLGLGIGLGFALLTHVDFGKNNLPFVVTYRGNGYVYVSTLFHNYVLEDKQGNYEIGDILRITGTTSPYKITTYESRYSFLDTLNSYGISESISGKVDFIFKGWIRFGVAEKAFLSHFEGEDGAILGKLLFGAGGSGSAALEAAGELDLFFVLSSGGFLFGGMLRLVERFVAEFTSKKTGKAAALGLSLLFLPLALRKLGILRVIMTRFLGLLFLKREYPRITLISLSGIALLIVNPFFAYQSSYLLGYGLSLLFVVLGPLTKEIRGIKKRLLSFGLLRLFLLPVQLLKGKIHLLSPIWGLVIFPISMLTMTLGYISFISVPFTNTLGWLCNLLVTLLSFFQKIDLPLLFPALDAVGALLYILIYFLSIYLEEGKFRRFRNGAILSGMGLYLISLVPIPNLLTSEVIFVNVGQGDCIVMRDGFHTVMMDTGGVKSFDMAEESLIPFLLKKRIYHIDVLIGSHGDFDHVGAAESLIKKFNVGRYITEAKDFPLTVGKMNFVNYNIYDMKEDNDKSLVLSTRIGNRSFLLTGDAPIEVEKKIIADHPDLRCDILKLGHHGSKTSSCAEFLDCLSPKEAVISCGGKNSYGHPHAEVIKSLKQRNIKIRRTDQEGSIVYLGLA